MMLSARLEQCAGFFASPKNAPDQHKTEDHRQRAGSQSPTRTSARALERSAQSSAKRQDSKKHRKEPTFPSHSRRFSIYHDAEHQDLPEKKVRFDLTQNDVHEFKRKAPPSPRAKSRVEATWEAHQPGVNDFMFGGIAASATSSHRYVSRSHALRITNDQTVAWFSLDAAVQAMPFKIVSTVDLRALNVFEDGFPEDIIGDDFHITYLGIQHAIEDAENAMRCENEEEWSFEEILVGQLARRAGLFPGFEKVHYVEDMVPIIEEEDENYDEEYWVMVWSQGAIWDQLSGATKEALADHTNNAIDEGMSC